MKKISQIIDRLNNLVGESAKWLCLLLVFLLCFDVIMRYCFSNSKVWMLELEWHLFALIFLLGAGYTFLHDEHVRVDVFYSKWSKKKKAWHDLISTIILLLPWTMVVIYYGINYGLNSFSYKETSPNPGGLPALYIIKFAISFGFILLLLQAISSIIKQIVIIKER